MYQSVNQFADPSRQQQQQPSPVNGGRPSPVNYQPMPPQPQPQHYPHQQHHHTPTPPPFPPQLQQPLPPHMLMQQPQQMRMPECGTLLAGNTICRRPVNRPGEKCSLHVLPPKQMSDYAKAPPPVSFVFSLFP